ncbi:MYPU_1760 family metalloprotease [Mycoplasma sp. CSL10166]|uniref:MYPU_1760 family metalloprotease n=1 Tax=Mycoplasma sp. CSL10166 TaxID=2813825 RepID=UPI00197B5FC1|nr:hypothetical protein [Mycoplasma sp. CSL10166]MBN4084170.1 hypothetical protein [Mycoplasma sp. CSL10166]
MKNKLSLIKKIAASSLLISPILLTISCEPIDFLFGKNDSKETTKTDSGIVIKNDGTSNTFDANNGFDQAPKDTNNNTDTANVSNDNTSNNDVISKNDNQNKPIDEIPTDLSDDSDNNKINEENSKNEQKDNKENEPSTRKLIDINLFPILKNEASYGDSLSSEELYNDLVKLNDISIDSLDDMKEMKTNDGRFYYEYQDPYTKIFFRDFSYYTNQNDHRYLLGKSGIVKLAQEFKRKIPFGTEVFDLDGININDFKIIGKNANGLYIPSTKTIYINGSILSEQSFNEYQRIGGIMPTVFHEYIHHWATSYAETGLLSDPEIEVTSTTDDIDDKKRIDIYYDPNSNSKDNHTHGSRQYWNAFFTNKFYNLLNYDVDKKGFIDYETLSLFGGPDLALRTELSFMYRKLSANDLWNISNSKTGPQYLKNPENYVNLSYSPSESFKLDYSKIKYYYSLTELLPREYLKFAYEAYFNMNHVNEAYENRFTNKSSIGWFGLHSYKEDNKDKTLIFSPSANADDWSKVFLNNFDSFRRQYMFQDGKIDPNTGEPRLSAIMYPTSVFDISTFKYTEKTGVNYNGRYLIGQLPEYKTKSRSEDFYKLFLKTMGYGKTISQIYFDNDFEWVGSNGVSIDEAKAKTIKFTGFLDNKNVSGIVLKDSNNQIYKTIGIEYYDLFNFFGHKDFDQGATLIDPNTNKNTKDRENQIANRLYPENKNYFQYITKEFVNIKNNSLIYLWTDLNKNGIVEEDELNSEQITLPEQRWVSSQRSSTTNTTLSKYKVIKDENNRTKIEEYT